MSKEISRRTFLKGAAVGAVGISAGLLGACSQSETPAAIDPAAPAANDPAPQTPTQQTAAEPMFTGADRTYGSVLNPQEDFSADSGDYSAIFSPLKIGGVTLKNRLVKSCAGSEMQKSSDWPDETSLSFYEQFCKGGVGMVCFEVSGFIPAPDMSGGMPGAMPGAAPEGGMPEGAMPPGGMPEGAMPPGDMPADAGGGMVIPGFAGDLPEGFEMGELDFTTDAGIPAHKAIADRMHSHGVPIIAQMHDMMMMSGSGSTFSETTKLETSFASGVMQTTEQVHQEQQYFIDGAERYYKAGFDGIELNASCNHYFSTFLSRFANHVRTDQYSGASIENRARVLTEIIEGIRKRVGNDFIIQVLYSGIEENVGELGNNELCITIDEACELAKLFEKAGASCLHIRSQAYGHHCGGFMPDVFHQFEHGDTGYNSVIDYNKHFGGNVIGRYDGVGALINVASKIKSGVSIPVGAVGSMDPRLAPDLFNNAIKEGKIDYLLMTRPLMADSQIANKLQEGRRDEIAPCTHCMTCFVAPYGMGTPMYCRVNPALTRAYGPDMPEGYDPVPADEPKKVMVIGGGAAGMEAARIAAQRGHKVSLYEKSGELGGRMSFTQKLKGPHERIEDHRRYLIRQLEVCGVSVNLNKEVDANFVKSEAPDAVVVAVGGAMGALEVNGNALTFDDLSGMLENSADLDVGESIVIIGGQFQACEVAVHLARRGKKVVILNPGTADELYLNAAVWPRLMGQSWLAGKGVKVYNGAKVKEIKNGSVLFDADFGGSVTISCDNVINALPMQPNRALFESISGEAYAVGDCYSPNTMANATARANIIARKLGTGAGAAGGELADNQFSATAVGMGDVTVTITVDGGKITAATVDTANETAGIGQHLGEKFAEQIVSKGEIDAVSGATVTVKAAQEALLACKAKAGLK